MRRRRKSGGGIYYEVPKAFKVPPQELTLKPPREGRNHWLLVVHGNGKTMIGSFVAPSLGKLARKFAEHFFDKDSPDEIDRLRHLWSEAVDCAYCEVSVYWWQTREKKLMLILEHSRLIDAEGKPTKLLEGTSKPVPQSEIEARALLEEIRSGQRNPSASSS